MDIKRQLIPFGLVLAAKSVFCQLQHVTKLDGTKVSFSEIDKTVGRLMDAANIQGLGLVIINNNKTVFVKSYGYRNKPNKEFR